MDIQNVEMYVGSTLHNMFEAMVPKTINGHVVESNFTVEEMFSPHCDGVAIHLHMEFVPNSSAYDGRYDFNYREMIPIQYLLDSNYSGRKAFETGKANVVKDMVNSIIISITDMDKRFPPDIQQLSSPLFKNVITVETLKTIMSGVENGTFKEEKENEVNDIRTGDGSDASGESSQKT